MKEYEIITELAYPGYKDEKGNFIKTGEPKEKINIVYYEYPEDVGTLEFFGPNGVVRPGYTKRITNQ